MVNMADISLETVLNKFKFNSLTNAAKENSKIKCTYCGTCAPSNAAAGTNAKGDRRYNCYSCGEEFVINGPVKQVEVVLDSSLKYLDL